MDRPELTVALLGEVSRPEPNDVRELVPATGGRVEELLIRMMEEKRALRHSLGQAENQSSWHSGNTRDTFRAQLKRSPISFGPTPVGTASAADADQARKQDFLRAYETKGGGDGRTSTTGIMGVVGSTNPGTGMPRPPPPRPVEARDLNQALLESSGHDTSFDGIREFLLSVTPGAAS